MWLPKESVILTLGAGMELIIEKQTCQSCKGTNTELLLMRSCCSLDIYGCIKVIRTISTLSPLNVT